MVDFQLYLKNPFLQSFFFTSFMFLFSAEQDPAESCTILIHSSYSVKFKHNYENKNTYWSFREVRLEPLPVLQE